MLSEKLNKLSSALLKLMCKHISTHPTEDFGRRKCKISKYLLYTYTTKTVRRRNISFKNKISM
jgi:hypothetical protein